MIFTRLFIVIGVFGAACIACAAVSRAFLWVGLGIDAALLVAALLDYLACPMPPSIEVTRECEEKLSLGAENVVTIRIRNRAPHTALLSVRDEVPFGFGTDRERLDVRLEPNPPQRTDLSYHVFPHERGDHEFGDIYVRSRGPYGLIVRQSRIPARRGVRVYPNLIETAKYNLLMRRGRRLHLGVRPVALMGVGTEFESLRDYQPDDEYRQIDWKATARRGHIVSRAYQAERSQNIIIALDTGRTMCVQTGSEAEGGRMAKLDYAVNSALMLAYAAATGTDDRIGLLTFADRVTGYIPPRKGKAQLFAILQALYNLGMTTLESDYAAALRHLAVHWRKRSLIVLFTDLLDVESSAGLISHLAALASTHLCLCVIVGDPEVKAASETVPQNPEQVYQQTVARQITEEREKAKAVLSSRGVTVIDAPPGQLSPAVVNKYLELKYRARL